MMRHPCLLLAAVLLFASFARAGLDLRSGTWLMRGGSVITDTFSVSSTNAALRGHGGITAPANTVDGLIAPAGESDDETGTLQFDGPVALNGVYLCKANGDTDLDLITATGPVTGNGQVLVVTNLAAIPLQQIIIAGAPASDFTGMEVTANQASLFQLDDEATGNLVLTDLLGDRNSDGLPDWWEMRHFNGRTNADPAADDDGDDADNLHEYGAGTNPTNGTSFFALSRVAPVSGSMLIEWLSVPGKAYTVQEVNDHPGASNYNTIASNIAATPPRNTWTNVLGGGGTGPRFYRISIDP